MIEIFPCTLLPSLLPCKSVTTIVLTWFITFLSFVCQISIPSRWMVTFRGRHIISALYLNSYYNTHSNSHTLNKSVSTKVAAFWVVAADLWNAGKLLPDYTALQPRRQPPSYSPPWEPQSYKCQWSLWPEMMLYTTTKPTGTNTITSVQFAWALHKYTSGQYVLNQCYTTILHSRRCLFLLHLASLKIGVMNRNIIPTFATKFAMRHSLPRWRQQASLKRWLTSARLHGATSQKSSSSVSQSMVYNLLQCALLGGCSMIAQLSIEKSFTQGKMLASVWETSYQQKFFFGLHAKTAFSRNTSS
jgi:hypothetical protein